jgi:hypothetical protein
MKTPKKNLSLLIITIIRLYCSHVLTAKVQRV